MSEVPTNDEIIDELTEGIETACVDDEETFEDAEDGTSETTGDQENIPKDYIDEEKLAKSQADLTEEEKVERRKQSQELKARGNEEFKCGNHLDSINTYTEALQVCPVSYTNDRSVLYSNRAASKIKLERNQPAIDDCTKAIELDPKFVRPYLRRAALYREMDKLEESLEDYKKILELDPGIVEARKACVELPPIIQERQEKLKEEMLGKLKDLGNMILKPFGLSTENFNLQQDPNTGGYSVNFAQNK